MKTDKELGYLSRDEYRRRELNLQSLVNPKPPKEEVERRLKELHERQNR